MMKEIKYRDLDELLDSVRNDLVRYDLEGMINSQELIKVVERVNFHMGLRVNPNRQKCVELEDYKACLPSDFYALNFALLIDGKKETIIDSASRTYTEGLIEGISMTQQSLYAKYVKQKTVYANLGPGLTTIAHDLHTMDVVVQVKDGAGNVLAFTFTSPNEDEIILNSQSTVIISNAQVIVMGAPSTVTAPSNCATLSVETGTVTSIIAGRSTEYTRIQKLQMYRSSKIMEDCYNLCCDSSYKAWLEDGYIHSNFAMGTIYLNYISAMEDSNGRLLTFDHPLVNEYYEYAIKQRIFENLLLNGERVDKEMQLVESRYNAAQDNAIRFITTPDFSTLKKMWETNRKAMHQKYYYFLAS